MPITRIGTEKVPVLPDAPPPPKPPLNWRPREPAVVGEVRLVWVLERRSLNWACTAVTLGMARRLVICAVVRGVPPPWPPKKPAGATVMVLPVDARTVLILALTASRAISIEMDRAIATAKMTTTPTDRMAFLKAFRTPRRKAFIARSFP